MKQQVITQAIVLRRTDFQEADRILTLLTSGYGKVSVIAKGVRRARSKLAGGIELFSVSEVTFIPGSKDISTLVSTRLKIHYGNIVKDINRTMMGYEFLKCINKTTEDAAEAEYFELLAVALEGLNDLNLDQKLVEAWFFLHLLRENGRTPELQRDAAGGELGQAESYNFDFDAMSFHAHDNGQFTPNHIKLLRLAVRAQSPQILGKVRDIEKYLPSLHKLITHMYNIAMG